MQQIEYTPSSLFPRLPTALQTMGWVIVVLNVRQRNIPGKHFGQLKQSILFWETCRHIHPFLKVLCCPSEEREIEDREGVSSRLSIWSFDSMFYKHTSSGKWYTFCNRSISFREMNWFMEHKQENECMTFKPGRVTKTSSSTTAGERYAFSQSVQKECQADLFTEQRPKLAKGLVMPWLTGDAHLVYDSIFTPCFSSYLFPNATQLWKCKSSVPSKWTLF